MSEVHQLLKNIQKSMFVYDREGEKVGRVSFIFPGTGDNYPTEWHSEGTDEHSLDGDVREAIPDDRVPVEVRERLLKMGFVKISTGLLASDCYALPEQIESVHDDTVHLSVNQGDTFKF